ncbi:MAG: potassium channel protein, partial [Mogibacterium sp.]|nr:potassium channel protein [Mogibacterium sp.]
KFIKASIDEGDAWIGKTISEIAVPSGSIIALILRDGSTIVPKGDIEIRLGDKLIICAESATEGMLEDVKEIILRHNHDWNGQKIKDLDISRQTLIIVVERDGRLIRPYGDLILEEGDKLLIYTKENIRKFMKEPLF